MLWYGQMIVFAQFGAGKQWCENTVSGPYEPQSLFYVSFFSIANVCFRSFIIHFRFSSQLQELA